jgi:hypothetical protein
MQKTSNASVPGPTKAGPAEHARGLLAGAAMLSACLWLAASAALCGTVDGFSGVGASDLAADMVLSGQGWRQFTNLQEMAELLLAVLVTAALTAAIAFHPVVLAEHRTAEDHQEPRSLFLYALVGLLVGFMVMHHGYLIGFVIFGIGG